AHEAVKVLRKVLVDAVVCDLTMPGEVSAEDLLHWIMSHRPELATRVMFTVSSANAGESSEFIRKSGCLVMQKPFSIEDFWSAVEGVLGSRVSVSLKS